ncbi:MAG: hypothetical protein FWC40_07285 [Proteobacteria bacterium]|nr:hypothetical protein [Pseudomonadota bacterium]
MTDYRNSNNANESEGLIGQRNENSVLFSLDSLASFDDKGASDGAKGDLAFGGSGDASGLIDLNTLSRMGAGKQSNEEFGAGMPVFNNVASHSEKRRKIVITLVVVFLVAALGAGGYYFYDQQQQKAAATLAEQQRQKDEMKAALEAQAAEIAAAKAREDELKQAAERRAADQEAVRLALAEAEAKQQQNVANAPTETTQPIRRPGGTTPRPPAGNNPGTTPDTPVATPKGAGPTPEAVRSSLADAKKKAEKCAKDGNLVVSMTLSGNGKASSISVLSGSFKGTPTEKCIVTVIERHPFPTFTGSPVTGVRYDFKL